MTAFIMKRSICFGQVERALLLDRILGGDHHERLGQGDTLPADGRGTLGMASSMADWVLAFERLISSSSTKLA